MTTIATFDLPLKHEQLHAFRGAMAAHAEMLGLDRSLFDNYNHHTEPATRLTRYSPILFQVHGGYATMMGWNKGAAAVKTLANSSTLNHFEMNGETYPIRCKHLAESSQLISFTEEEQWQRYKIPVWLPLEGNEYKAFYAEKVFARKLLLLEKALKNDLVHVTRSLAPELLPQKQIESFIELPTPLESKQLHGTYRIAFSIIFHCNLHLPKYIGLGHGSSHGYGAVVPYNRDMNQQGDAETFFEILDKEQQSLD